MMKTILVYSVLLVLMVITLNYGTGHNDHSIVNCSFGEFYQPERPAVQNMPDVNARSESYGEDQPDLSGKYIVNQYIIM